jgi:uncharacterized protein (DUF1330 family)
MSGYINVIVKRFKNYIKGDKFMNPIMAIKVNGRDAKAAQLQEILTKYGCNIKTRIGFHETNEGQCSVDGIIILQLFGSDEDIKALFNDVKSVNGVIPKFIEF